MNGSTIVGMQPEERLSRTLPSTSKFSIIGKGNRPGSGSCLPRLMNDGSMKNDWQHEIFGTHPVDAYFSLVQEERKPLNHLHGKIAAPVSFVRLISISYRQQKETMKDREGLKSTISSGHGESKGTGRSSILDESDQYHGQKIDGIRLRTTTVSVGEPLSERRRIVQLWPS